ncbi:DUF2510 domain-containing protein, partial [Streptomyces triticirhizae]
MSQTTPPGWYQDPGRPAGEPARERWWDGAAWTARTRPAEGARTPTVPSLPSDVAGRPHSLPTLPGEPPPPAADPPADPAARGRRRD